MNDMINQIADILLQDHVELMRQNKEMREAIEEHRRNIWGESDVKHDEDRKLYAAIAHAEALLSFTELK